MLDYFKNYAFYCMPDDIEDIKEKTHISMNTNFNEDFKILIKKKYSWSHSAQQTYLAYKD